MIYQPPLRGTNIYNVSIGSHYFPYHWHKEIELLFCISGYLIMNIENIRYKIQPNQAILVNCSEEHSFEPLTPDTKVLVIEVGDQLLGDKFCFFTKCGYIYHIINFDYPGCDIPSKGLDLIHSILKNIIEELNNDSNESQLFMTGYLLELFASLARYVPMTVLKIKLKRKYII